MSMKTVTLDYTVMHPNVDSGRKLASNAIMIIHAQVILSVAILNAYSLEVCRSEK